jgi:hypothetical protein
VATGQYEDEYDPFPTHNYSLLQESSLRAQYRLGFSIHPCGDVYLEVCLQYLPESYSYPSNAGQ